MQNITDKQFILSAFVHTILKIDFYRTKIERKFRENGRNFCENEVDNFNKNTSKFAKILNENERISFNENFDGNSMFKFNIQLSFYLIFKNTIQ